MEETLSLPVNASCLPGKRAVSPQSGHESLIQSNHIVKYTHYHYYYEIQGQRFEVANSAAYDALDERFWYRVYYLPRSHRIVNIEPLGMLGYR